MVSIKPTDCNPWAPKQKQAPIIAVMPERRPKTAATQDGFQTPVDRTVTVSGITVHEGPHSGRLNELETPGSSSPQRRSYVTRTYGTKPQFRPVRRPVYLTFHPSHDEVFTVGTLARTATARMPDRDVNSPAVD